MKIFFSGASFSPKYGGPAVSVSHLAAAIAGCGAQVGIWAPDGTALTSDIIPDADIHRLGGSLRNALGRFGTPDVVHDSGLWLPHNHRIAVYARRAMIPRVVSARGMLEPWAMRHKQAKKFLAWHAYQKRDLRSATLLHATSMREAESLRRYLPTKQIITIPNGVDLPDFEHGHSSAKNVVRGDTRVALFLGRLHPVKGLPLMIRAWAGLRPAGWKLLIAGPDEAGHRSELEALVEECRLGDALHFLGPVAGRQKSDLFETADLFVLPTLSENFGMVVAEALAYRLPVLTTREAPWPELEKERCGWWTEPTVAGLSAGLAAATAATPETLIEMGERGRALVGRRYAWGTQAKLFLSAYRGMIRGSDEANQPVSV